MEEKIIEKIKAKAEDIADLAGALKELGTDVITSKLEEIGNSLQFVTRSGFRLDSIETMMGLPPEILGLFKLEKDISEEDWEKLLKETEDNQTTNLILTSLHRAMMMAHSLKIGNVEVEHVTILFSIPPGIGLNFKPVEKQ